MVNTFHKCQSALLSPVSPLTHFQKTFLWGRDPSPMVRWLLWCKLTLPTATWTLKVTKGSHNELLRLTQGSNDRNMYSHCESPVSEGFWSTLGHAIPLMCIFVITLLHLSMLLLLGRQTATRAAPKWEQWEGWALSFHSKALYTLTLEWKTDFTCYIRR